MKNNVAHHCTGGKLRHNLSFFGEFHRIVDVFFDRRAKQLRLFMIVVVVVVVA